MHCCYWKKDKTSYCVDKKFILNPRFSQSNNIKNISTFSQQQQSHFRPVQEVSTELQREAEAGRGEQELG